MINCIIHAKDTIKTRKHFFVLIVLNLIFSCAQTPQQRVSKDNLVPQKVKKSIVCIVTWQDTKFSYGSGFFVAPDQIATNIHVVAHQGPTFAKLVDSETIWLVEGITGYDVKNDLVVLKISGESTPLPLTDSDDVQTGTPIVAFGYPDGKYKAMPGTIARSKKIFDWLRIKVKTSVGSSGGPVLNKEGNVIGIIVGYRNDKFHSYAIPANTLKVLLADPSAFESLREWRKRDVIRASAYDIQGQKKYRAKDYKAAITNFDKAIQLNPDISVFYYNRGTAKLRLAESTKKHGNVGPARELYQAAIDDYTQTIEKNPWNVSAYRNRGHAKVVLGQKDSAKTDFDKAMELTLE
ncbi:hypothetical protein F4X90_00960 [Candidatus Poribacteria bacterium]|nr:hypothetical protein [Candidatus Poribacteria bacterium]